MNVVAAAVAALLVIALGFFGLTQQLGAHPFWAFKVTWIGAPIGAILFLVIGRLTSSSIAGIGLLALGLISLYAAFWGKTEFAASYGEDAAAGRVWYFGWIATATFSSAAIAWFLRMFLTR